MKIDDEDSENVDIEAIRRALERYAPGAFVRFGIPRIDREDILQEILTAFWKYRKRVREPQKWISGALRNQCFLYLRTKSKHRSRPYRDDLGVLQIVMGSTARPSEEEIFLKSDIHHALSQLNGRQRRLLLLRFWEGLTPAEAAEWLGYKPSSMKKVTNRAIRALREVLLANGVKAKADG